MRKLEQFQKLPSETLAEKKEIKIDPDILLEAEIIADRVGGDFGMKVKVGEIGQGSFFDPEAVTITIDPSHFLKEGRGLEEIKFEIKKEDLDWDRLAFLLGHEGGHRAITKGPNEIGIKGDKINELQRKIGFFYGSNCVEDPADNNWVKNKFPKIGESMSKVYDEQTKKENVPAGLEHPDVQRATAKLGYVPKFAWFGAEVIRYWWKEKFSRNLNPDVREAVERVKDYLPEIFKNIPSESKIEEQVIEKARERFSKYYDQVWPELEKLVKKDIDDEKINQMQEKMFDETVKQLEEDLREELQKHQEKKERQKEIEKTKQQKEEAGAKDQELKKQIEDLKKQIEGASDKNKKDLEKQLEEKQKEQQDNKQRKEDLEKNIEDLKQEQQSSQKQDMENQMKQAEEQGQELNKQIKELEKKTKGASGKEKQGLEKQLEQKQNEREKNQEKQNELKDKKEDLKKDRERYPSSPQEDYSEELKKKLKEIFDRLDKDLKKELEEAAKKELEDLEDKLNKDKQGKLNKDKPKSHQELRKEEEEKEAKKEEEGEEEEEAKKEKEEREKAKEVYEEAKEEFEEKLEKELTTYDKVYREVSPIIEKLYQRLKKIFEPIEGEWESGFISGQKIDIRTAIKAKIKPELKMKIFERRRIPKEKDFKFLLLIDMSGSMEEEEKIGETFKGVVVLTEVLNKLNIPVELVGFSGEIGVRKYKDFKEKLDEKKRNKIAQILKEIDGGTPTDEATEFAWKELTKDLSENNFLITLTDGDPDSDSDLKEVLGKIEKEKKIKLVGIGLGKDTGFVKKFYPASLHREKIISTRKEEKSFDEDLAKLLEVMIRYPEKKFHLEGGEDLDFLIK